MSLLNEAYRLRFTGGNEPERHTKKRKALTHLDKTLERAEHAHKVKRAKAEAEFRKNPRWTYRIKNGTALYEIVRGSSLYRWKEVREGTAKRNGRVLTVYDREQWLSVRGLAPLSEDETPSMDILVRRHLDRTEGKEADIPLTTTLLKSIRDACA